MTETGALAEAFMFFSRSAISDDDTVVGGTDSIVGGVEGWAAASVVPSADGADGPDSAALAARRCCIASRMPGLTFI